MSLLARVDDALATLIDVKRGLEGNGAESEPELYQRSGRTSNRAGLSAPDGRRRIVCLIDGDGYIFHRKYLMRGADGGVDAAKHLTRLVQGQLFFQLEKPYKLHVLVFLNRRGLSRALHHSQICETTVFEEFIQGFNQSSHHFAIIDVGPMKEAADVKIRAYLEDELMFPQTLYVIFGGCHDNGYALDLRHHVSQGYGHKLILLEGRVNMGHSFHSLDLSIIRNDGLFEIDNLDSTSLEGRKEGKVDRNGKGRQRSHSAPPDPPTLVYATGPTAVPPESQHLHQPRPVQQPAEVSYEKSLMAARDELRIPSPTTPGYSWNGRTPTAALGVTLLGLPSHMEMPPGGFDTHSRSASNSALLDSDGGAPRPQVDRRLPIYNQKPPLCPYYYIKGRCIKGSCNNEHQVSISEADRADFAAHMRRVPCYFGAIANCKAGSHCVYSHQI